MTFNTYYQVYLAHNPEYEAQKESIEKENAEDCYLKIVNFMYYHD